MKSAARLVLLLLAPALARAKETDRSAIVEKVKSKKAKSIQACEAAAKNSLETVECIKAGDAFLAKDLAPEARTYFEKGCERANAEACHRAGETARSQGHAAAARGLLKRACEQEWWPACESLGDLEERAGRPKQAVDAFRAACNHDVAEGKDGTRACERFAKAKEGVKKP